MTLLLTIAALLWPVFQQPASSTVRVRLFSARQPSEVRITPDGGSPMQVRASGGQLLVNSRSVFIPFRIGGPATLQPAGDAAVRTQHPVDISVRGGTLIMAATIPREDYVAGVLAGEASILKSDNSLKAMAVAARTYAARFMGRHNAEGFDFCDTTHCQDYRGVAVTSRIRKAVTDTRDEILWHEGTPIKAYYHQDCGGVTERKTPYLPQLYDAYCISRGRMQWVTELTRNELQSISAVTAPTNLTVIARTASGRASRLRIEGTGSKNFDAEEFRLAAGRILGWERIRSDLYDVRRVGDRFVFEGYGAGHGIGLCQNGAAEMGESGKTYREILAYYYPGTVVGVRADGISWMKFSGARAELETTRPQDTAVLDLAGRLMRTLEESTARRFESRPLIRIYPTVAAFRDATGEPGWLAGSTRDNVIRLQPAETLRSRNTLESTLDHELAHLLLESRAHSRLPLWFREGVTLWLTQPPPIGALPQTFDTAALERALTNPQSEAQLRQSYRTAQLAVEALVRARGKQVVLSWIEQGLPGDLGNSGDRLRIRR